METLHLQLRAWAEQTVAKYIKLANQGNDYAFYTQSDLTKLFNDKSGDVDVMVLGINPGLPSNGTSQYF